MTPKSRTGKSLEPAAVPPSGASPASAPSSRGELDPNPGQSHPGLLGATPPDPHRRRVEAPRGSTGGAGGGSVPPWLQNESNAPLERQLLLAVEPGLQESAPKLSSRQSLKRIAGASLLVGLTAILFFAFLKARRSWEDRVLAVESQLTQASKEGALREETLRRDNSQKERLILERKAENQSLAGLADKTLEQLKTSLDDLRRLREEKVKLEADYRASLECTSAVTKFFAAWLPDWLRKQESKGEEGSPQK